MIQYLALFTHICFLITVFCVRPMDPPAVAKKTNTLIWLSDDKIIFASRNACYIKNPFSSVAKCKLHDESTHHIITNKDNTKVGLFCPHSFYVYNIATRKKIWTLAIPYSDNYSATFNPTDDIIMFHKGIVSINNKQMLNLPFIQVDQLFDITCNQHIQEIMYPSSNNTFSRKSLTDNQITRHPRSFKHENINYKTDAAFYTPHNNYIILHTHQALDTQQQIHFFLLNTLSKTTMKLPLTQEQEGCSPYYDVKILPNSCIAVALCNKQGLHFFDITQKKQVLIDLIYRTKSYACKNYTNMFDFCPQAQYYTVITQKKSYLNKTPECLLRYNFACSNIYPTYLILCNYLDQIDIFVPKEVKALIIKYFYKIYRRPLKYSFI